MNAHEWSRHLAELAANERNAGVELLLALEQFDARGLWRELGHSGLFSYLHVELGMSKTLAFYKKVGVQLVREVPAVVAPLRDGRLCVSALVELAKVITPDNCADVLPRFFGRSRREAQRVAVEVSPLEAPPVRDVIVAVRPTEAVAGAAPPAPLSTLAPAVQPAEPRAASLVPLTAALHRVHFTASDVFIQKLDQVKEELARQFPDGDLEAIFEAGLDLLLEQAAKGRSETERPRASRSSDAGDAGGRVPAGVKRAIWKRDRHRCQWPLAAGGICGERRFLEIDHIVPRARGGPSTLENTRLLCRFHNQLAAREVYGDAWMDRFAGSG